MTIAQNISSYRTRANMTQQQVADKLNVSNHTISKWELGINTQVLQNGAAIRTAVVFFYLSNEGLSILENSAVIGIPIPEKLKDMLIQLTNEKHIPDKNDENEV